MTKAEYILEKLAAPSASWLEHAAAINAKNKAARAAMDTEKGIAHLVKTVNPYVAEKAVVPGKSITNMHNFATDQLFDKTKMYSRKL